MCMTIGELITAIIIFALVVATDVISIFKFIEKGFLFSNAYKGRIWKCLIFLS